jgi:hypothetical protein
MVIFFVNTSLEIQPCETFEKAVEWIKKQFNDPVLKDTFHFGEPQLVCPGKWSVDLFVCKRLLEKWYIVEKPIYWG